MAKITARRKSIMDNPEEVLTLAQVWLEQVKRQWKWLALGLGVVVIVLAGWFINGQMREHREAQAAAALDKVRPQLAAPAAGTALALEQMAKEHPGTKAARAARLLRANLLYKEKKYAEAAKAYEALLPSGDPAWDAMVSESLSYCYEGQGDFQKAAATLKGVLDQASAGLKSEETQRLAVLLEQAGDFREAAVYWKKLLAEPGNPALQPYLQEKLAAAEARIKK